MRTKMTKWLKGDPGTWFHRAGILALLGTAITVNFIVEFAVKSSAPLLVATALLTALFLSLVIVIWNRSGFKWLIFLLAVTVVAGVVTYLQLPGLLEADPFPDLSPRLAISFWITIAAAILTVALSFIFGQRIYNPELTPIKNGISLFGVLFSALAFNLDPSLGSWIGWTIIAITLFSLEPIWKSEAETADEIVDLELEILRLQNEVKNRKATLGQGSIFPKGHKSKGNK